MPVSEEQEMGVLCSDNMCFSGNTEEQTKIHVQVPSKRRDDDSEGDINPQNTTDILFPYTTATVHANYSTCTYILGPPTPPH